MDEDLGCCFFGWCDGSCCGVLVVADASGCFAGRCGDDLVIGTAFFLAARSKCCNLWLKLILGFLETDGLGSSVR